MRRSATGPVKTKSRDSFTAPHHRKTRQIAVGFMLFVVVFLVHWSLTTSRAESAAAAASSALSTTTPAVFSYAATETDEDKSLLHQNQSRGAAQRSLQTTY